MRMLQRPLLKDPSVYKDHAPYWIAEILARRGIEPSSIDSSLINLPKPTLLPDMEKAVSFLLERPDRRVFCVVDYDTDGISSGTILKEGLTGLGFTNVEVHVTQRHLHGYGFSQGVVDYIKNMPIKPEVIITADLGSSDGKSFSQLDIPVIVTDHHHISETTPPKDILAFVNPTRKDIPHGYNHPICGAFVAWNLIASIRSSITDTRFNKNYDIKSLLDIAAVATIGDMMDLSHPVNRAVVKYGLSVINAGKRPAWGSLRKQFGKERVFREDIIGFQISPRINALSRMGDETHLAMNWLLTKSLPESYKFLNEMTAINDDRKLEQSNCEDLALAEAEIQVNEGRYICVCYVKGVSHGVVGLAANKVVQKYNRPTIVIADNHKGEVSGSARSILGYDIRDAIVRANDICGVLKKYGGHAAAAGLSMENPEDIKVFSDTINEIVKNDFNGEYPQPVQYYDEYLPEEVLTKKGYQLLSSYGPFGQGFVQPSFRVKSRVKDFSPMGGGKHLKINLTNGKEVVWFNKTSEDLPEVLDIVVTVNENWYSGRMNLSLIVLN